MRLALSISLSLLVGSAVFHETAAFQTPARLVSHQKTRSSHCRPLGLPYLPSPPGKNDKSSGIITTNMATTGNGGSDSTTRWAPLSLKDKILLPLQVAVAVYLLLLLPADFALERPLSILTEPTVMGSLPYEYFCFFSVLVLPRAYQYGQFDTPDEAETTAATFEAVAAPLAFALSLIGAHWIGAYQYVTTTTNVAADPPNFLFFFAIRILATILVGAAGLELGKSYDRVTRPDELVSTGPYSAVRNPIYTAYLFFFGSTLLWLRAETPLAVLLVVAAYYYDQRIGEEEDILAETFGEKFEEYKEKVPWRILPFLY